MKSTPNYETIYLEVAEFIIAIKFILTEELADYERRIKSLYQKYYSGFITQKKDHSDYWIVFNQQTNFNVILNPQTKTTYLNLYEQLPHKINTYYHISPQQFQVIIRDIIQKLMSQKNGIFLHASASLINQKAYLFLGDSGAGKSTTTQLLSANFPILGDDSAILKKHNQHFFFYQTPLYEKNYLIKKTSQAYPLGGLIFLQKKANFKVQKLSQKELITKKILKQLITNSDSSAKQIKQLLQLVEGFDRFYNLEFSLNDQPDMLEYFKSNG